MLDEFSLELGLLRPQYSRYNNMAAHTIPIKRKYFVLFPFLVSFSNITEKKQIGTYLALKKAKFGGEI